MMTICKLSVFCQHLGTWEQLFLNEPDHGGINQRK